MAEMFFLPRLGDVNLVPTWAHAGVPSNGTTGTVAGIAGVGDLLVDTTNAVCYQNTGTTASPTWTQLIATGGSVASITSGTINGATIGGTTPAAVTTSALHVDTGTKTATASSGAATLNKMAGVVTSEALTTIAGATYTLTLTNSNIAATDQVFASVEMGASTTGTPAVTSVTPGTTSVVIVIQNIHATAGLNGAIKIAFLVVKN